VDIGVPMIDQRAMMREFEAEAAAAAAADSGRIPSLSHTSDPELTEENGRRPEIRQRRVAPKRKVRELGPAVDEGGEEEEKEKKQGDSEEEEKEEPVEEEEKSEGGHDAAGDAQQSEDEWTRFLKVDRNTVRVEWANGEITNEPRAEFEPQIDPMHFAYHASIAKMSPTQQRGMLALMAKSRSKAAANEHKPRATRSGHLVSGVIRSVRKSKKARLNSEQEDEGRDVDNLQTSLACVDISQTTCS